MVSPLAVETVIQEGRGKQAEFKGEAGIELVDDLPWRETSLMGIGTSQVEVELVERRFAEEVGTRVKGF